MAEVAPADLGVVEGDSESSTYTPRVREKTLPPSPEIFNDEYIPAHFNTLSPVSTFHSPMPWGTPKIDSPFIDKPLPKIGDASDAMENTTFFTSSSGGGEWSSPQSSSINQHRPIREALCDSSLSFGSPHGHYAQQSSSNHSDSSTRLSCSTLASSTKMTASDSSTAASPSAYGFAFGSPKRDKDTYPRDYDPAFSREAEAIAVGLGLSAKESIPTEEQYAVVSNPTAVQAPYYHHRVPSWTMLSGRPQFNNAPSNIVLENKNEYHANLPLAPHSPLSISVPARGASRSRSNSSATSSANPTAGLRIITSKSSLTSTLSRNISVDEAVQTRPGTARSMSTNSISSSTADSSYSRVSPRTSSLKRTKSRPTMVTKGSESDVLHRPRYNSTTSRSKSGSLSEAAKIGTSSNFNIPKSNTNNNINNDAKSMNASKVLCSPEILEDYLAVTVPDDFFPLEDDSGNSPSLAVTMADEGKGVLLFADGRPLSQIERLVGPSTTHLVLSGCQDANMIDFLERTLPMIGHGLLVLDVSNTGLTRLPEALCHCSSLEELNISSNPFTRPWTASGWAKFLTNLRILVADDCQFTILPRDIGELRGLKTLSLERNDLSHLPSWLHQLDQLDRLSLDGNPFQGAWQRICEAFIPKMAGKIEEFVSGDLSRPPISRNVASAPSRVMAFPSQAGENQGNHFLESSYEELEEIVDVMPATAPLADVQKQRDEKLSRRPLIRRMLSSSGEIALKNASNLTMYEDESSAASSPTDYASGSRRPSLGAESAEKKWGRVMRKLTKKASNSTLIASNSMVSLETPPPSHKSGTSSPERTMLSPQQALQKTKITCPLTPVGWQDSSNESPIKRAFGMNQTKKRSSFLALSQDSKTSDHRRKLRALMQYLQDLDDLRALRVGPPGSVLPMEKSMASRYSPSQSTADSKRQSGSETSAESSISSHTSSDQSDQSIPSSVEGKDDAQRRVRIIQEIISTEESYIRGLQELVEIYVVPSASIDPSSGQRIIPSSERRKVFGNIEGILHFHQGAFLPALQSAADIILKASARELEEQRNNQEAFNVMSASVAERVAVVFSRHSAFFRMYSAYVNNVDAAQARVALWKLHKTSNGGLPTATNPQQHHQQQPIDGSTSPALTPKEKKRIKTFLTKARIDPRHSQLSLETYLHLPVQRIPRYRLLFEDLVRNCPSNRLRDSTSITSALESIRSIATLMNESKRQSEKDRKLLEWQARVRGNFPSPLVQPHRRLIRDGNMSLKRVVMRTTAFHMSRNQMLEEESKESIECDGAVTDTDLGIVQVDCLDQQCMDKGVGVLLCNDITVVVVKDSNQLVSNQMPSQVDLFAVLRIQGLVKIIGQTTLRVVDPKHILYFTATSPDEAIEWKEAMNSVNQEPRPLPRSTSR